MRSLTQIPAALFLGLCGLVAFGHANEAAQITRFHVNTNIQMRYAMTQVEMQVKNTASEVSEVFFDMYIPKEAFVSNFLMDIKGQTYVAKVETKEEAKEIYDSSSTSSGLVQSQADPEFKDGKQITFSAKVDPQDKVVFKLDYEELLQRKNGQYHYELNIQPKYEVIKDLEIKININESLPLKDVSVQKIKSRQEITSLAESLTNETVIFDPENEPSQAEISYTLPTEIQTRKDWKMVVNYDVDRPNDGSDIQIAGGRFVHYFAPDDLPTLPKHVTFVIDVSGSMSGDKLKQTKDAMTMILENMNDIDSLNILKFSDEVYRFEGSDGKLSWAIDKNGIFEPMQYCLSMRTIASTNINDAMLEALNVARQVKQREEINARTQQMIIFLTDGEATTGVTYGPTIKSNVKEANTDKIPIYGLAFGEGADFGLISEISEENHGFARRIYESGNSFEQLEDFYKEISDPKLKNVKFQYLANGNVTLEPANLTKTDVDFAFGKNEYTIVGDFGEEINEIQIIVQADDEDSETLTEINRIIIPTCRPGGPIALPAQDVEQRPVHGCIPYPTPQPIPMPTWHQTETESFMERLWAFKRIKYLLNDKEDCRAALRDHDTNQLRDIVHGDYIDMDDSKESIEYETEDENVCQNEAINLAKKYNFVTDVTSMVVESNDEYVVNGAIDIPRPVADEEEEYQDYSQSIFSTRNNYNYMTYSAPAARPRPGIMRNRVAARPSPGRYSGGYQQNMMVATRPTIRPYTTTTNYHTTTTTNYNSPSGSPCTVGNMKLWSQTYLRGDSVMLNQDANNLLDVNFDNNLASLEIRGRCCWIIFTEPNFAGQSMKLSSGKYESSTQLITVFKAASSAKSVYC